MASSRCATWSTPLSANTRRWVSRRRRDAEDRWPEIPLALRLWDDTLGTCARPPGGRQMKAQMSSCHERSGAKPKRDNARNVLPTLYNALLRLQASAGNAAVEALTSGPPGPGQPLPLPLRGE